MYVISFGNGGGIRVREGRLFARAEDTGKPLYENRVTAPETREPVTRKAEVTPWDWE